jgi:hypothetical protein
MSLYGLICDNLIPFLNREVTKKIHFEYSKME